MYSTFYLCQVYLGSFYVVYQSIYSLVYLVYFTLFSLFYSVFSSNLFYLVNFFAAVNQS